jgi:hypothetical protein
MTDVMGESLERANPDPGLTAGGRPMGPQLA